MIEKSVKVITDIKGGYHKKSAYMPMMEYYSILIYLIYIQEALVRSQHSTYGIYKEIYGYKYKIRICFDKVLTTGSLIHLLKDRKWVLQLKS